MNKVIIIANLCKDPELRHTQNGTAICVGSIAWNEVRKEDKKAHFFRFKSFGKTAEFIHKHLHKGEKVCFEGRLNQNAWEGKDGQQNSVVEIVVERIDFVGTQKKNEPAQEQTTSQQTGFDDVHQETTLPGEEMF
jgi:single-strand DNA-binding protein